MQSGYRMALAALFSGICLSSPQAQKLTDSTFISMVPSGFPVGFDLLTQGNRQYVAYYDSSHAMVVASRRLDSAGFTRNVLPSKVAWDTHNYITMELDGQGHLHVSGNMHVSPLDYYRTTVPGDVNSLVKVPNMVLASHETKVTYPHFLKMPSGEFYFLYRQGSSGDGVWYVDKYDSKPSMRAWSAVYGGGPLFSNAGSVNAYFTGPTLGPDGRYHFAYLWRDTPDASTCHDISYIRSKGSNLDAWETVSGESLTLPISMDDSNAIVDRAPIHAGLINSSMALGFDTKNRAIVSYHKYDAAGISQVYNSRWSEAERKWIVVQASDWKDYKWDFGGGGSIPNEIAVSGVQAIDGKLVQTWTHSKFGGGTWTLDENTLKPLAPAKKTAAGPMAAMGFDLKTHMQWTRGEGQDPNVRYAIRWQTLLANRDVAPDTIPPDSRLMLLKYTGYADALVRLPKAVGKAGRAGMKVRRGRAVFERNDVGVEIEAEYDGRGRVGGRTHE